ncbi:MAG: aminopeptidase P family protein [Bacteroidaceae bacterium]|nr:aminopeptidase P family protein [Bacteroidaceae bacterium]MBP3834277.1 aminopeptidase P family protein [Bacteroidaceae bacterium]
MTVKERIASLRETLKLMGLKAFIVPSTDPHMSEYVASHWEARQWISGFTGSAGTIVVTEKEAGLWTDSRYFLQASEQLQGTGIDLYKEKLPETPSIAEFLKSRLSKGDVVGIDGQVFSLSTAKAMRKELGEKDIELRSVADPFKSIWKDRPPIPQNPIFILPIQYAGEGCQEKVVRIRQQMEKDNIDVILITALDEIAWVLNLRGSDVHCNPVFISYLLISHRDVKLFIDERKLTPEVKSYLNDCEVKVYPYIDFYSDLERNTCVDKVLADPAFLNYAIYQGLSSHSELIERKTYVAFMKAIRNQTEIDNLHHAMAKDGVAMVKFLKWLDTEADIYHETEMSVDRQLHSFRAVQADYIGESFDTIAGYGAHGAIVHYEATPETDAALEPRGFLLLDSGAQYLDGTTDITRTIPLGYLSQEEKEDYTLILKGHIDLAMAVFPEHTRGSQLDILARQPIWQRRLNYLHGTGHGVGSFLNVHEGPHNIRMEDNPVTLQAGMVVTDEPGIYKAGSHGVRTENILLVVPAGEGMFGNYLQFETITLCPIDKRPIVLELLSPAEIDWLNRYHAKVYEKLSPYLDKAEQDWLRSVTTAL